MRRGWQAAYAILLCAGCMRSSYNLASQRQEYSFTSTDREVEQGRRLATRVVKELTVLPDESVQQRVRDIGQRLAAVCDRRELVYQFTVLSDPEVNAFSLPGGYVFVNDGLVKKASGDDEVAAVIAHEIAHIAARHAVRRFESGVGLQLLQLAAVATRQAQAAQGVGIGAQAAQMAYARDEELEADRLTVKYLKAAGFDPKATLSFLGKLEDVHRQHTSYLPRGVVRPQYALSHPFVPERLRAAKEALYGVADYIDYLNTTD